MGTNTYQLPTAAQVKSHTSKISPLSSPASSDSGFFQRPPFFFGKVHRWQNQPVQGAASFLPAVPPPPLSSHPGLPLPPGHGQRLKSWGQTKLQQVETANQSHCIWFQTLVFWDFLGKRDEITKKKRRTSRNKPKRASSRSACWRGELKEHFLPHHWVHRHLPGLQEPQLLRCTKFYRSWKLYFVPWKHWLFQPIPKYEIHRNTQHHWFQALPQKDIHLCSAMFWHRLCWHPQLQQLCLLQPRAVPGRQPLSRALTQQSPDLELPLLDGHTVGVLHGLVTTCKAPPGNIKSFKN